VFHRMAAVVEGRSQHLLLLSGTTNRRKKAPLHIEMLRDIRSQIIIEVSDSSKLQDQAKEFWEATRSQDGFILAARALYKHASDSSRGKHFNEAYKYISGVFSTVRGAGIEPTSELAEVALHTYYHWQLKLPAAGIAGNERCIDWAKLMELSELVLRGNRHRRDQYYLYICALSLAHLDRWSEAKALFQELRKSSIPRPVLFRNRDYLRDMYGRPRRVQGVVRSGARDTFIDPSELPVDFKLDRKDYWPREGESAMAYVAFSFGGPSAIKELRPL
jgi:hypothetical protein